VILPSKKIKDKRNDEAQQQAGSERKIKGEAAAVEIDVAGELAEPGNLRPEGKKESQCDEQDAEKNKRFAESTHCLFNASTF
jgi:hypothetical protein